MQTQFIKAANPIQQKVRQIPIQLQERIKKTQTDRPKTHCQF